MSKMLNELNANVWIPPAESADWDRDADVRFWIAVYVIQNLTKCLNCADAAIDQHSNINIQTQTICIYSTCVCVYIDFELKHVSFDRIYR